MDLVQVFVAWTKTKVIAVASYFLNVDRMFFIRIS